MAISAFKVVKSTTLDDLETKANEAITNDGLQPIGNLFQDQSGYYCLPMGVPVVEEGGGGEG